MATEHFRFIRAHTTEEAARALVEADMNAFNAEFPDTICTISRAITRPVPSPVKRHGLYWQRIATARFLTINTTPLLANEERIHGYQQ